MAEPVIYVNGEFVPESEARISVMDHAVLYGDGVFDTVAAWGGRIFKLDAHVDRFFRSCQAIALKPPFGKTELARLVCEAVRRNGLSDAYVKWVLTRGSNGAPLMDPDGCVPNLIIITRSYIQRPVAASGLRMKTAGIRRPSGQVLAPQVKSLNYLNLVMAKIEAKAAKVDHALLLDMAGRICEAPGFNLFLVAGRRLRTPRDDILEGITRATVMELAPTAGLEVSVEALELYDAYTADEMFLTGTAGGLLPVTELDGRMIGEGRPGPVFAALSERYRQAVNAGDQSTDIG